MSQPVQVYNLTASGYVDPAQQGQYSVIDNGAPGNIARTGGAVVLGAPGVDNCANGAVAQSSNKFTNGNIPDCNNLGLTTISCAPGTASLLQISWKNPA